MKAIYRTFSLILLSILMVQCTKEEANEIDLNISDTPINIDEIINFIPSHLLKSSILQYINADGDKMELKSVNNRQNRTHKNGEVSYTSETTETRLFSETNHSFNITIYGVAHYQESGSIVKSLTIRLMPMVQGVNIFLPLTFSNGEVTSNFGPPEIPSLELLGKSFKRVFMQENKDSEWYSEVFFSPYDGIIGFRDEHNGLWVLDEVIE